MTSSLPTTVVPLAGEEENGDWEREMGPRKSSRTRSANAVGKWNPERGWGKETVNGVEEIAGKVNWIKEVKRGTE